MSTLTEIEEAIAHLPPEQWREIRRWMDSHAAEAARPKPGTVDWTASASVTRNRPAETRLVADVVMQALAEVRE